MSVPETVYRGGRGEPVYHEVEEHGQTRLVLMRKAWRTWTTPAHDRLRLVNGDGNGNDADLTYEREHVAAVTMGESWWEKA